MNKALDYNGLLEAHKNKLQLKKNIKFPLWAEVKYDGNFVSVKVENGETTFITSGNLTYTHTDTGGDIFCTLPNGVYEAERISNEGKLGDRVRCNLHGPKNAQLSSNHTYKIFDTILTSDWVEGATILNYEVRNMILSNIVPTEYLPEGRMVYSNSELEEYLKFIVNKGYEGLMLKQPDWYWKRTKSRTTDLCKYKKRRTADLLCTDTTSGTGKYTNKIGSLLLEDSNGKVVFVGSGLSDTQRSMNPRLFIGKVVEIEYEQIIDTYIQPTFIQVRDDKLKGDID